MPKNIELAEIAKNNPRVDLDTLEKGRNLHKSLHESTPKRHRMKTPSTGRRVRIDDAVSSDPRVVRLQRTIKVKR